MAQLFKLITPAILIMGLTNCGSNESPFVEGGGIINNSGTNIVSEKNFNIAFDPVRPIVVNADGERFTGIEVTVIITTADRSGLRTPGVTVYLDVDWGILSEDSCVTEVIDDTSPSQCSITWRGDANFNQPFFPGDPLVAEDEFITFTGWTLGEESFIDINDNGIFDDGDGNAFLNDTTGPFLDINHNDNYDIGTDKVLNPGNSNGILTPADTLFNGVNCTHSTLCSATTQIYISDRAIIPIFEEPAAP